MIHIKKQKHEIHKTTPFYWTRFTTISYFVIINNNNNNFRSIFLFIVEYVPQVGIYTFTELSLNFKCHRLSVSCSC